MEAGKKITRNIGWLVSEKVVRLIFGITISGLVARHLGPGDFGLLNYAISIVLMASCFVTLGLESITVRELVIGDSAKEDRKNILIGSTIAIMAVGSLVGFSTAVAYVIFACKSEIDRVAIALVAIIGIRILFKATAIIDYWNQSQVESKYSVAAQIAGFVASISLRLGLVLGGASLVAFGWAFAIEGVVVALALVIGYQARGFRVSDWKFKKEIAFAQLKRGFPLMLSGMAVVVNLQADRVMTLQLASETEAGLYSAAARLSEVIFIFPVIIMGSFAPQLTKIYGGDKKSDYLSWVKGSYALMSVAGSCWFLGIVSTAWFIVPLIFGDEYIRAIEVLMVHGASALFLFHVSARSRILVIESKTKMVTCLAFCGLFCNIVGNLILIPKFGALGASYASLLSWGANAAVFPFFFRDTRLSGANFWRSLKDLPYLWKFVPKVVGLTRP